MARTPNPIKGMPLTTSIPEDVYGRISLYLWSDLEQRIPHGAFSRFITDRAREFFTLSQIDLAPYLGSMPGACVVSGTPETIEHLKKWMEQQP